jgi:hypothetical protein
MLLNRGDSIALGGLSPTRRVRQRVLGDSRPERRRGEGSSPKAHVDTFHVGDNPLKALKSPMR